MMTPGNSDTQRARMLQTTAMKCRWGIPQQKTSSRAVKIHRETNYIHNVLIIINISFSIVVRLQLLTTIQNVKIIYAKRNQALFLLF